MKKTLLTILSLIIISSCGNKKKENEEQNINLYDMSKVTLFGVDNKEYEMETLFAVGIKDLITYDVLQKVCMEANVYAKFQIKNRRTYKPNTSQSIFFMGDDNDNDTLKLSFDFIAANAYGVEGDLTCHFYFDKNGDEIKNASFIYER